jgi:hypothetical protein
MSTIKKAKGKFRECAEKGVHCGKQMEIPQKIKSGTTL